MSYAACDKKKCAVKTAHLMHEQICREH